MTTCTSSSVASGAACTRIAKVTDKLQSLFLLGIRIYIGYQCMISGWAHLHNLQGLTNYFQNDLHFPQKLLLFHGHLSVPFAKPNAAICSATELIGGALLLLGLGSRLVALVLAFNFAVAILTVELSNSDFLLKELGQNIWNDQARYLFTDTAFPYFATAVIILLFGPGWFSLDGIVRFFKSRAKFKPAAE
jgi:putative oxidoreductase